MTENSSAETGYYPVIFPNARRQKFLNDSKHNSLSLALKFARYLALDIICSSKLTVFVELRSQKTVLLLGKDNVRGQISQHILAPNGGYCLFNSYALEPP